MARPVRLVFLADDSQLQRALTRLVGQTSATQAALRALERTGADLHRIGRSMTMGITAPTAIAAAGAVFLNAQFEATMTKIQTLAGATAAQVKGWSKELLALGPALGKTPEELAEGLYYIASSGFEASEAMEILTASAKASAIGMGDTKVVADAVTSAMNAYAGKGLSAARATDILLRAIKDGKGEAADLASSIGMVIPIASQLDIGFEEVAAAMASLTLSGASASEAATQIRGMLDQLLSPSEQVTKALGKIGLTAQDVHKSFADKGLLQTLDMFRQKIGNNSEEFGRLFPNVRGLLGVLTLVGPNGQHVADVFKDVAAAGGDVNEAFGITKSTSMAKFHTALATLSAAGVTLGAVFTPAVAKLAVELTKLIDKFNKIDPETRKTILVILALTAAVGPLLFVMGGFIKVMAMAARNPLLTVLILLTVAFITAYTRNEQFRESVQRAIAKLVEFGNWIKRNSTWILAAAGALTTFLVTAALFSALSRTFGILVILKNSFMVLSLVLKGGFTRAVAMAKAAWLSFNATFFASPWGIAIAALLAVGVAFFIAYKKSETFRNFVHKVFHAVAQAAKVAWDWIVEGSKKVWAWLKGPLTTVFRLWLAGVTWYLGMVWKVLQPVIGFFREFARIVGEAFTAVSGWMQKHWNVIKPILIALAALLLLPLIPVFAMIYVFHRWGKEILGVVGKVFSVWWSAIKLFWSTVFTVFMAIVNFLAPVFKGIYHIVSWNLRVTWAVVSSVAKLIWEIIQMLARILFAVWSALWAGLTVILKVWWAVVSTVIKTVYNVIVAVFSAIWRAIGPYVTVLWNNLKVGFTTMVNVITSLLSSLWGTISSIWNRIYGFVAPIVKTIAAVATDAFKRMRDGIAGAFSSVADVVRNAINAVIRRVNSIRIPPVTVMGQTVFDGWSGPSIPYLANGGLIDKPTLAMVGEAGAELVLPLTRKQRAMDLLARSGLLGSPRSGGGSAPSAAAPAGRPGKSVHIENLNVYGTTGTPEEIGDEVTWQVRAALL